MSPFESTRRPVEFLDALGELLPGYLSSSVPGGGPVEQPAKAKRPPALRALRRELSSGSFDPNGPEAARLLQEIWNAAFPQEPMTSAAEGEHWKQLGFQSRTPTTDLRAGPLGLHQLHRLAVAHPQLLRRLAAEAQEAGYPLACSCFNVTQLLVVFFGLSRQPVVSPVSGASLASPVQLRNFDGLCALAEGGPEAALDGLFLALVERLHDVWRLLRAAEGLSLMEFERALREVHKANARFWEQPHTSLAELRALAVAGTVERQDSAPRSSSSSRRRAGVCADPCPSANFGAVLEACHSLVHSAFGKLGGEQRALGMVPSGDPWEHRRQRSQPRRLESDPPLFGGRGAA